MKRFIGQTDTPLDEIGKGQALFWKKIFAQVRFDEIYTSSLTRCQATANLICPGKEIRIDPRLNEINLGTWDGKSFDHIKETMPELFQQRGKEIETFRPPKGESFNDLSDRVFPFFKFLKQEPKAPTLIITHSGVIRVLLCRILGMDPKELLKIKVGYAHLFLLKPSCQGL